MITVGLGEISVTNDINEEIITYALGSCIAIIVYSHTFRIAGMAHSVLAKESHTENKGDRFKEGYYVNTAIPKLFNAIKKKTKYLPNDLIGFIIGGSMSSKENDYFKIGEKNSEEAKKILATYNLRETTHDVGGYFSRTVSINVRTGQINIKKQEFTF